MAGQSFNSTMMMMLFLVLLMAHVSHSNTVDSCVKHCPNQCLKAVKDATHVTCENACKKMCNEPHFNHEKYFVPTPEKERGHAGCRYFNWGCQ